MSKDLKQWLIKDGDEKVYGPYDLEKIYYLIESYVFSGVEKIAEYPSGDFISISHIDNIYDKFLEVWEGEVKSLSPEERSKILLQTQIRKESNGEAGTKESTASHTDTLPQEQDFNRAKARESESISFVDEVSGFREDSITSDLDHKKNAKPKKPNKAVRQSSVEREGKSENIWRGPTELTSSGKTDGSGRKIYENTVEISKHSPANKRLFVRVFGVLFACVIALFFYDRHPGKGLREIKQVSLIAPKIHSQKSDPNARKKRINTLKQAIEWIELDEFSNYRKAQSLLVDSLEENGVDSESLGLLCLTYKELWPYAKRDSQDLSVVSKVNQVVSSIDVGGKSAANCRSIQFFIADNIVSSEQVIDKALQDFPGVAAFYSLKGEAAEALGHLDIALSYYQKVQVLWPKWIKSYWDESQIYLKKGNFPQSAKLLREILERNPEHKLAAIQLAEIELRYFRNLNKAKSLIQSVSMEANYLPRQYRSKSFYVLALINQEENNNESAIRYAKQAYELDTRSVESKNLLEKLAGKEAFLNIFITEQELLENGDLYFRQSNYLAAQAEYKAAFEVNATNDVAGIRAAQSLWKLNQSEEAIRWLKKTIAKNPKSLPALLTLADYQVERYDFESASKNLRFASSLQKNDYRIFRSYANFEWKKNSYKAAIDFSEKAIKLYDTDMESHYIMAKSLLALSSYDQAFKTIARAVSLEPTNVLAQSLYAEVLASFQGVDAGVRYITNLINTYPSKLEYREGLARIYLKDNRWELAVGILKPVTEVRADYKPAFLLLASAYIGMNKPQDALESYLAAASLDPTDASPFIEIGKLYLLTGKFEKAREQFERSVRLNPNYPRVNYLMGRSLMGLGKFKEAIDSAMKEKSRNPMIADPNILAADAYLALHQYNKAISEYQAAVQLRPQSAEIYVKIAICYRLIGNLDVADQMLGTAIAKESGYPEIYKEAGAIMEKRGKNSEAIEAYQKYLSLKPSSKDAEIIRGRVRNLGG